MKSGGVGGWGEGGTKHLKVRGVPAHLFVGLLMLMIIEVYK